MPSVYTLSQVPRGILYTWLKGLLWPEPFSFTISLIFSPEAVPLIIVWLALQVYCQRQVRNRCSMGPSILYFDLSVFKLENFSLLLIRVSGK